MPQNPENIVNPGDVNVVNQGDGLLVVEQAISTGPSTNSGALVNAGSFAPGLGGDCPDQPITVTPPMTAQATVEAGTYSPTSNNVENVISNNVANQIYGVGVPSNVFV